MLDMLWLHAQICFLNDAVHKESKHAIYVLSSAVSVPNWANPGLWELQIVSITALMQMQAIKQNNGKTIHMQAIRKGKQQQTRKTVRETKASSQNGATASKKESGHSKRCIQCKWMMRARKTMHAMQTGKQWMLCSVQMDLSWESEAWSKITLVRMEDHPTRKTWTVRSWKSNGSI